jgi:hypothetical protein
MRVESQFHLPPNVSAVLFFLFVVFSKEAVLSIFTMFFPYGQIKKPAAGGFGSGLCLLCSLSSG